MALKDKRVEVYNISLINKNTDELVETIKLEEILIDFFTAMKLNPSISTDIDERKFEYKPNNVTYFEDEAIIEDDIIKVKFSYIISNKKVNIVDSLTLQKKGQKELTDGDLERQHILIKLIKNSSQAILVFEKIPGAIPVGSLRDQLNIYLNKFYSEENINLFIQIHPLPNEDFLTDLSNTKRISAVKLHVDRDDCISDPDLNFSGSNRNLRETVELVYKPKLKERITKTQVQKIYSSYRSNPEKICRIIVEANGENGKIRLDTNGAKLATYIKTNLDIDGLVDTSDIFKKFENFINTLPSYLMKMCIEEEESTTYEE